MIMNPLMENIFRQILMRSESQHCSNASCFRGNTGYIREIQYSHGDEHKEYRRLGCDGIQFGKILPTFGGAYCFRLHCRRNI
jgi:hypothetical protein